MLQQKNVMSIIREYLLSYQDHEGTSTFVGDANLIITGPGVAGEERVQRNLRNNLILQATDEKCGHLCDVGENRLTGPDLVA